MKSVIKFEDFAKIEIRIGTVIAASVPEGSKKLIRQVVDFGEEIGKRVIFSGILEWYKPEDLVGKQLPYVINLEARMMPSFDKTSEGKGEESQGMLMATAPLDESGKRTCVLLVPQQEVELGAEII